MAWRNPQYAYEHAARAAGVSALSSSPVADANGPLDFLIDDRAASLFEFDTASAAPWIELDRGTGTLGNIDRLLIPPGHNLDGTTITVETGASSPPGTVRINAASVSGAGLIDEAFSAATNDRYVRLSIAGPSAIYQLAELVYTLTKTTTRGPEPGWRDELEHSTLVFEKESGAEAALALGPDRRALEYSYRSVSASADLAVFHELLEECGTSRPFWLDPAFDTEAPVWVRMRENARQTQDPSVPAATISPRKHITLRMIEHLA